MAYSRALSEGFTLSDGVLPGIALPRLMPVIDALIEHGHLSDVTVGMAALSAEWIARRTWRYEGAFSVSDDDERCAIELERLFGAGRVYVNGQQVAAFEGGGCFVDVTGWVQPGENRLAVAFDPPREVGVRLPRIGMGGAVRVVAFNYMTLEAVRVRGRAEGAVSFEVALSAHVGGQYTFRYALADEDGPVAQHTVTQRLPAAARTVVHEVAFEGVAWEREKRTNYDWKLLVERGGIGCALAHGRVALAADGSPARIAYMPGGLIMRDECALYALAAALGVDAIQTDDAARRWDDGLVGGEFPRYTGDVPAWDGSPAFLDTEALKAMADGARCWPPDGPMWRLRGGKAPDPDAYAALMGPAAFEDVERFARLTRLLQAERLHADAVRARAEGRQMSVLLAEDYPSLASSALVEFSGAVRPAFWALRGAWRPLHGCAMLPEGGAARAGDLIELPIWLFSDAPMGLCAVSATAYGMDGAQMGGVTIPAFADGSNQAGALTVHLPEGDGLVLIRVEVALPDGALADRWDGILAFYAGEHPLVGYLSPPRPRVDASGGRVLNGGGAVALGVSAGRSEGAFCGYGALLPGEAWPIGGAVREAVEWYY